MNSKYAPMGAECATGTRQLSVTDRMLDMMGDELDELEHAIDRLWSKTDPIRMPAPCCPSSPEGEQPSMSAVPSRIRTHSDKIRSLKESIYRLTSEIEL